MYNKKPVKKIINLTKFLVCLDLYFKGKTVQLLAAASININNLPTVKPRVALRRKLSLVGSSESKTPNYETQIPVVDEEQVQEPIGSNEEAADNNSSKQSFLNRAFALIPFSNEKNKAGHVSPSIVSETANTTTPNQPQTPKNENTSSSKTQKLKSYFSPSKSSGKPPVITIDSSHNPSSQNSSEEASSATLEKTESLLTAKQELKASQSSPNLVYLDINDSPEQLLLDSPQDQASVNQIVVPDRSLIKIVSSKQLSKGVL